MKSWAEMINAGFWASSTSFSLLYGFALSVRLLTASMPLARRSSS